jgi:broad specificity phosphatase PhoE
VKTLVAARHAETELNVEEILNGDPAVPVRLTTRGREQARALGATVGPVDLVAHTSFERTRETAELAWPGTPTLDVPELNEIAIGRWEGTRWDEGYAAWVGEAGPDDECPGGGESRVGAATRYVRGFRILLGRTEDRVALVAHGAPIRYLLLAAAGKSPTPLLERVGLAQPNELGRDELESAIDVLERWLASPAW